MIFTFGNTVLDVDVEKTRDYYESALARTPGKKCSCAGCQNFDSAILRAPEAVQVFLRSLGIDPQKPCEVFGLAGEPEGDGTYLYGGWYHAVGSVVKGEDSPEKLYKPAKDFDFTVGFSDNREKMGYVTKGFPTPVLELSVSARLHWLL